MNKDTFILSPNERPSWVEYPRSFCRMVDQGLINITPWHLLEGTECLAYSRKLGERYPFRDLFPFAYRQDNDDFACWAKGTGERVFIIHDFSSPGWEEEGFFDDVWSWFREAVEETIAWD
jgi:hypothetical protein